MSGAIVKERIEEFSEEIIRIPQIRFAGGLVQTDLNALVNEALEMAAKECEGRRYMVLNPLEPCAEARVDAMRESDKSLASAIRKLKV